MPAPSVLPISEAEELTLHRRLLEEDPTAFTDLAGIFLTPLISALSATSSQNFPEEFFCDAAGDALVALVKNPCSFNPEKNLRLGKYLLMSARGDLKNRLQKEKRRSNPENGPACVELTPEAGNCLEKHDDPSLSLEISEEYANANREVIEPARHGLTEGQSRALDLVLQRERKTELFAEVLGITDLPKEEQRREVKRVKDMLKTRLKRGAGRNG